LTESRCVTPSGSAGQCIRAQQCQFVKQLVEVYGRSIPEHFRAQVRKMQCQGEGNDFYVCCSQPEEPPKTVRAANVDVHRIDAQGLRLLSSIEDCGNKGNPKVAGGKDASPGQFPWMALLKYDIDGPRPFLCSGSLITESHILTAAHCIVERPNVLSVRLGEHNLDTEQDCTYKGRNRVCLPPYEEYEVDDIRVHPNYIHGQVFNDIAIIKLKGLVRPKSHIKPICLPITEQSKALAYDESFYIAGWGRTDKTDTPSVLQRALVQRQGLDVCRQFYDDDQFNDNHICAAGKELKHTCQGDSGGPVFIKHLFNYPSYRFVQYGIVSFGEKRCGRTTNQPGLFANVLDMLPWITQNLQ
ncbi:hypothetical protein KR018_010873, partial [Drosophila ironensis]